MMASNNAYIILLLVLFVRFINCVDIITTIAGSNTQGYSGDNGVATGAGLYYPEGVRIDTACEQQYISNYWWIHFPN